MQHSAAHRPFCIDQAFSDRKEITMGYRLIAVVLSLLVIVGVSVSLAQIPAAEPAAKALDPDIVAVRLILGIGDATPQDWSGRVALDKGEILDIEGVRFRDGDMVTGRDSWKTSSRLIRKAAAKKAAAKAKAAGQGQASRPATKRRSAGPGTTGPTVTPNGVVLALKNVAGATLTVDTQQGKFTVAVDRLADGAAVSLLDDRVSAQRVFPHAPLFEGPKQQDFPAAAADSQGAGAWVAAVWHEPRGPELLPAVDRAAQELRRVPAHRRRRSGPASPLPERQGGRTARRHRARPRRLAPRRRHGRRWQRRRRLDREARRQLGPLQPPLRSQDQLVLARAAHHRRAGYRQRRRPRHRGQRHGLAGLASVDRRPGGYLARPARRRPASPAHRPSRSATRRPTNGRPAIAADSSGRVHVAFDSLPGRQLRRLAPHPRGRRHLEPRDHRGRDGRVTRLGPAWRPIHADESGSLTKNARPTGARTPSTCSTARARACTARARSSVAVVDGGRVLHAPDPLEHAPDSLKNMNSYPRLAVDRAGRPWLTFRHRQEAIWGNNAVIVTGAVWTSQATSLSGAAWSVPRPLTRSDGLLDNRPALVQPAGGPVLAFYSTDGRLRREVEMNPQAALKYFSNQGTPPGVFNVDLEVSALAATGPVRRASPDARAGGRGRARRGRPPRRDRRPALASGRIESTRAARTTACCAASSTAIPRSPPTAAPTARSKTCGAMPSTPPRSTGSATATTTTAAARNTPGG